jgi:hypothetical protein
VVIAYDFLMVESSYKIVFGPYACSHSLFRKYTPYIYRVKPWKTQRTGINNTVKLAGGNYIVFYFPHMFYRSCCSSCYQEHKINWIYSNNPLQILQSRCFTFGCAESFSLLVTFNIVLYPLLTLYWPCILSTKFNLSSSIKSNNGISRMCSIFFSLYHFFTFGIYHEYVNSDVMRTLNLRWLDPNSFFLSQPRVTHDFYISTIANNPPSTIH